MVVIDWENNSIQPEWNRIPTPIFLCGRDYDNVKLRQDYTSLSDEYNHVMEGEWHRTRLQKSVQQNLITQTLLSKSETREAKIMRDGMEILWHRAYEQPQRALALIQNYGKNGRFYDSS